MATWLVGIDEIDLMDFGLEPDASANPQLITDESSSRAFVTRRKDGSAGSLFIAGAPSPATWVCVLTCPSTISRDQLFAALAGDLSAERRLRGMRDDIEHTIVYAWAALVQIDLIGETGLSLSFEAFDSVWTAEGGKSTTKSFVRANDRVMRLAVAGSQPTSPRITITPTAQRSTKTSAVGWQYRQRYTIQNAGPVPAYRFPVRIPIGSTTALVSGSKALASGNDVRLWYQGVEQARTLNAWNSGASFLWWIVPALPANTTITVDVVYGNASAGSPPVLGTTPDLTAFDLAGSTNASLNWLPATAGKGGWPMSSATAPASPDFSAPGAWRPVLTLENPDNKDLNSQLSGYTSGANVYGILNASRAPEAGSLVGENDYDGVAFYWPFPITAMTADFGYTNKDGIGALVYLSRNSAADPWAAYFSYSAATASVTLYTPGAKTLSTAARHVAMAIWPLDGWQIDDQAAKHDYVSATWNSVLTLAIDTTNLVIAASGSEQQIYELATSIRIGGGEDRVAPYSDLLIGNARGASGSGTPRAAVVMSSQQAIIDCATHAHYVAASGIKVEDIPAHAVSCVAGWASPASSGETATADWLALGPARAIVPGGDFATGIAAFEASTTDAGMTLTRTWDGTVGGQQLGSLKVAITANSGGIGATALTRSVTRFPVAGRDAIQVMMWFQTSNANLSGRAGLAFEDDAGNSLGTTFNATAITPTINVPYDRAHAGLVPVGATYFRILLAVVAATAGATGNVWLDDISLGDPALLVTDQSIGQMDVTVALAARYLT